jgi:hypothetical protein
LIKSGPQVLEDKPLDGEILPPVPAQLPTVIPRRDRGNAEDSRAIVRLPPGVVLPYPEFFGEAVLPGYLRGIIWETLVTVRLEGGTLSAGHCVRRCGPVRRSASRIGRSSKRAQSMPQDQMFRPCRLCCRPLRRLARKLNPGRRLTGNSAHSRPRGECHLYLAEGCHLYIALTAESQITAITENSSLTVDLPMQRPPRNSLVNLVLYVPCRPYSRYYSPIVRQLVEGELSSLPVL